MSKVDVYTIQGTKKAQTTLPKEYGGKVNKAAIAQAVRVYEDGTHKRLPKTKTRSQVRISTRKIYKQKGTGGARHGAKSAPIFVGGGTAHGPKGIKRELKLPRAVKSVSLRSALILKADEGKLVLIEGVSKLAKTKEFSNLYKKIIPEGQKAIFCVSAVNGKAMNFVRNVENVSVKLFANLNTYDIVRTNWLLVDNDIFFAKSEKTVKIKKETKKVIKK